MKPIRYYSREQARVLGLLLTGFPLRLDHRQVMKASKAWLGFEDSKDARTSPVKLSTAYSLIRNGWVVRLRAGGDWILSGLGEEQYLHSTPQHRTYWRGVYRDALLNIASGGCCQTPGCSIDDPRCDTMLARAALGLRRCQKEGWVTE